LTLADSTDFTFGTNDFCIEFFYYNKRLPDNTSYDIIFDCMGSNRSGIQLAIETDGDYRIEVGDGASNWIWQSTGFDSKSRKWTHFALTREGSTFRAFEDGVLLGTQTSSTAVGDPRSPAIGGYASDDSTNYGFNGYISNFRIVNGSAVYTAAFTPPTASLTNVTNTKLLCCQLNTSATAAAVTPGSITANGDAAVTNFNPFITDIDAVRGQETGYATWNPLDQGSGVTLSEGNLRASINGTTNSGVRGTMTLPTSGKYFFAIEMNVIDNAADAFAGLMYMRQKNTVRDLTASGARLVVRGTGSILNDSTGITGRYFVGEGFDELGVAVDCDANTVQFYVNGAVSASAQTPSVPITNDWAPYCGCSSGTSVFTINAGQKPFKFPPPDGFQPLNIANTRPETVIARPDQYVGVAAYTSGNGSAVTVNSYNFAPELLWFKDLDDSNNWAIFDTVRGNGLRLDCSGAGREQDWSTYFGSFEPNGFTVTNQTSDINRSTNNMCSWGWKAGGNPGITTTAFWVDDIEYASAAAAGLNGGTITPVSASVGTRQGFSMLTYRSNLTTGATLSHGLTQKPDFAIFKNCDSTLGVDEVDWGVYHTVVGATKRLELNQNLAEQAFPGPFNDTEPTSSLFTFGGGSQGHSYLTNGPAGEKFVAWIWHNVPGLQKFGSYEGNGSSDGPFVELGFRPAVLILKCIDNYGDDYDWRLIDSTREPFNEGSGSRYVVPNKTDNQANNSPIDFLSNGFKIRSSTNEINLNAHTFVYAAWAAAPTFNIYGAQSNAR